MNVTFLHRGRPPSPRGALHAAALLLLLLLLFSFPARAAKVLIVGDLHYALVADVAAEIQVSLRSPAVEYPVSEVKGRLGAIVEREYARVVVVLGRDAVAEALRLPPDIAVVYGLVVVSPESGRANVTGVYMSPPVSEYASIVRQYLPAITKVSVVGSGIMLKTLFNSDPALTTASDVDSPADLVDTVDRLVDTKALLLLPDANLLTTQVMASVYLASFRKNIPLLGISEANVRQGSLFALVFDPKAISRQIGEMVQSILDGVDAAEILASPPRQYNLYINSNTARKMGIELPDELLKQAKKIY